MNPTGQISYRIVDEKGMSDDNGENVDDKYEGFSERYQLAVLCLFILVIICTAVYGGFYIKFILINVAFGAVIGGGQLVFEKYRCDYSSRCCSPTIY